MPEKKRSFPRWPFISAFMATPFLFVYMAVILDEQRGKVIQPDWLPTLRIILIILALLSLLYPYFVKRKFLAALRAKPNSIGVTTEQAVFFMGLCFSFMPAILGCVLFYLGAPAEELYYFAGTSFLAVTMWSFIGSKER
jgi:cytochrome bd-type quinol oxidase subunit 2